MGHYRTMHKPKNGRMSLYKMLLDDMSLQKKPDYSGFHSARGPAKTYFKWRPIKPSGGKQFKTRTKLKWLDQTPHQRSLKDIQTKLWTLQRKE